jgi:hypothetical protein
MNILPKFTKYLLASIFGLAVLSLSSNYASAASSYISPATGLITNKSFKVSVYVESTITEPQMSGSQIKLTYPQGVTAIAVTDGEFDSYLEKNIDSTTRTISINAVNNAGNEKNGKIKLASISFETTLTTGQIQLLIASDSTITGTGGEQLLTETVNGTYNLKIDGTGTATDTTATTTDTDATLSTTTAVPVTGTNETLFYLTIAAIFMTAGVFSYKKITVK